jgi:integrase/recombinase XerD
MVMQFEKAKQSFLDHLRIERALSENSISGYARDLDKYGQFLMNIKVDFSEASEDDVSNFEISLKRSNLAISSCNRAISAIKTFYKYVAQEFDLNNPTYSIQSQKVPKRLPKALTVAEVTALIDSTKRDGDLISIRDHAILEILYGTGARVSEVVGIEVTDFAKADLDSLSITTLKLRGKGSKERIVPLGSFASAAIEDYLVRLRPTLVAKSRSGKSESVLFLNQRGGKLSRQSAWQVVADAAAATGLSGKVSPHVFRHSYATHLLDGGADIRVVQELLGHSSVTTTQIYTLITIDKVREAYATAHPRAR